MTWRWDLDHQSYEYSRERSGFLGHGNQPLMSANYNHIPYQRMVQPITLLSTCAGTFNHDRHPTSRLHWKVSWKKVQLGKKNKVHHRNLPWNLKMMVSNMNLLFQGLIFRFHVKLRGSNNKQDLPPKKLTWNVKIHQLEKEHHLLKPPFWGFHVSFRGFKCLSSHDSNKEFLDLPKGCWMEDKAYRGVPIYHPLRFKQHPLEDAGTCFITFTKIIGITMWQFTKCNHSAGKVHRARHRITVISKKLKLLVDYLSINYDITSLRSI